MVTTRASARSVAQSALLSATSPTASSHPAFTHVPTRTTLIWLLISCILVTWDFLYVFLRPHSMPSGALHFLWSPYELYGQVDYVYGFNAWEAGSGFTGAQSALNVAETAMYVVYMVATLRGGGVVSGKCGASVLLVGFSAAVMTLSKTVLYWANEYFSGYANIGHNDLPTLVSLWIIPNGLWIVMPAYMIYVMGKDILAAMVPTPVKKD